MDNRKLQIQELEQRIRLENAEIDRLYMEYGQTDDNLLMQRIYYLQSELNLTNTKLSALKRYIEITPSAQIPKPTAPVRTNTVQAAPQQVAKPIPQSVTVKNNSSGTIRNEKKKNSIENRIGLMVMPVLAACLIFVSAILFANALPEVIGNIIKQITMYFAGLTFIVTGLILHRKKKGGAFGQVLIAIGCGELFVTIVLGRFVFGSLSDLFLFILIMVWSAALVLLKKLSGILFHVIGEVGIAIATVFGVCYCNSNMDVAGLYVVFAFYLLTNLLYYFLFRLRGEKADVILFHSFNILKLTVVSSGFMIGAPLSVKGYFEAACFIIAVLSFLDYLFVCREKSTSWRASAFLFSLAYAGLTYFSCFVTGLSFKLISDGLVSGKILKDVFELYEYLKGDTEVVLLLPAVSILALTMITEYLWKELYEKYVIEGFFLPFILVSLMCNHTLYSYGFIVLMIFTTAIGFVRKNPVFRGYAIAFYLLYAFIPEIVVLKAAVGVLFAGVHLFVMYCKKEFYSMVYKTLLYTILCVYGVATFVTIAVIPENSAVFGNSFAEIPGIGIAGEILIALLIITLIFHFTPLSLHPVKKKRDFEIATLIGNSVIFFYSAGLLNAFREEGNYLPMFIICVISVVWLLHGFFSPKKTERMAEKIALHSSVVLMMFFSFFCNPICYSAVYVIILSAFLMLLYVKTDAYSVVFKYFIYIEMLILAILCPTLFFVKYETTEITVDIAFILLISINALFTYAPLCKNPATKKADMSVLCNVINHVLVFAGIIITIVLNSPEDIISGVLTLLLIPMGTWRYWIKSRIGKGTAFLQYFSLTEYVFVPMIISYTMGAAAFVSSIIGIVIAVACVVWGFVRKSKGIRIYGLAVSMLMIFKLSLLDFERSSVSSYALAFFIAGMSCLIISMIYYFVNSAVKNNTDKAV